jgi:membrane-bound serine protease (ClpP class)
MRTTRWARRLGAAALFVAGLLGQGRLPAQGSPPQVFVVLIDGTIDLGLAPLVARTIREAADARADAVLLEINTFGGRVDAAVAIRDTLLNAPIQTIAFVNQRAISAGALIALACHRIVMTSGGTIGAAAPVVGGVGPPQPADEKSVSYVRKEFRATAETRGRPAQLAEAMVDADVEVPGVVEKGKLLTLTASEALQHKVADFIAPSRAQALAVTRLGGAQEHQVVASWAEQLVRLLTGPVISSLLMSLGILGLLIEIRTPGFGVPGTVGIIALALFLWGHWLVQLAGWEELLLLAAGLLLLLLELFVLPGFGVAGIAGLLAILAGLGFALIGAGATGSVILRALGQAALSVLVAIAAGLALMRVLPRLPFGRRLVLESEMSTRLGYGSAPVEDRGWLGENGVATSPLRPAGIADIRGHRVDVVSEGEFIEAGASLEVIRVDGNRVVVRRALTEKEHA